MYIPKIRIKGIVIYHSIILSHLPNGEEPQIFCRKIDSQNVSYLDVSFKIFL